MPCIIRVYLVTVQSIRTFLSPHIAYLHRSNLVNDSDPAISSPQNKNQVERERVCYNNTKRLSRFSDIFSFKGNRYTAFAHTTDAVGDTSHSRLRATKGKDYSVVFSLMTSITLYSALWNRLDALI